MLPSSPWRAQVGVLRCLRGVDTLTAVGLCAEVGDFARFARAEQLMSYVGLVPAENTTGQQRRLGSITKTGSAHARRLLVEAAWHYRPRPNLGKALDRAPGRSAPGSGRDRVDRAEAAAPHLDPPRSPWQAPDDHRGRGRPRARRVRVGDHPNRVNRGTTPPHPVGWVGGGPARAGNPRLTYEQPAHGRPRSMLDSGSPRRTMVLRHPQTRAYQSDRASRTASRTATHPADHNPEPPTQMREINDPHLTTRSPYQVSSDRANGPHDIYGQIRPVERRPACFGIGPVVTVVRSHGAQVAGVPFELTDRRI